MCVPLSVISPNVLLNYSKCYAKFVSSAEEMPIDRCRLWDTNALERAKLAQSYLSDRNKLRLLRGYRSDGIVSVRQGQKNPEHRKGRYQRPAAVAYEWKGNTGHRKKADHAANVDDGLKPDKRGHPRGE